MKDVGAMSMEELAAYVCSHLAKEGIDVVLSGGGCVAVYTKGQYVSFDLDFVENISVGRSKLKKALGNIDFRESGRYFQHPHTEFFLEFPTGPLAVGDEPPQKIVVLKYETGELKTLSPTDCIKDRLAAYFYWNDHECFEQAILVARSNEIDFEELERWAVKEGAGAKYKSFLIQWKR